MSVNTFKYSAEQLWIFTYHLQGTCPALSTLWQIPQQRSFYSYLMTTWIPFQSLHDNITYFHSNSVYRDQYSNMGFVMFICKYLHTFIEMKEWRDKENIGMITLGTFVQERTGVKESKYNHPWDRTSLTYTYTSMWQYYYTVFNLNCLTPLLMFYCCIWI